MRLPSRIATPALLAALALLLAGCATSPPGTAGSWSFAAMGDTPYSDEEEAQLRPMIQRMNAEPLAFVVHVGDIISGRGGCTDAAFGQRKALFQTFAHPFVLTPGDNDWTDCHRSGYDPIASLNKVRDLFNATPNSIGGRTMPLVRQSDDAQNDRDRRFAEYRENARWQMKGVVFVTLNVPGSNNNLGRTPEADDEHRRRMAANTAWLEAAVQAAQRPDASGLVIFVQANPGFDGNPRRRPGYPDGFLEFRTLLVAQAKRLNKPILFVHGDTHRFQVNKPLVDPATGRTFEHFTRLEVDGSPFVNWARVTVDPADKALFVIQRGREPL